MQRWVEKMSDTTDTSELVGAELEKWRFLAAAPVLDARHPRIQKIARQLLDVADGHPYRFVQLAAALARDCIRYEVDSRRVGGEDVAGYTRRPGRDDAIDALQRGVDDCDAKARLFVALCLAAGLRARMRRLVRGGVLRHVFASVILDGKESSVELTLRRARVGDEPFDVPYERGTQDWSR